MMEYKIPRGTYDILPADSPKWQQVMAAYRETAKVFGYMEIVTPVFEQAELFERSSGENSDVVQKEMYRFEDRKGRRMALRPEGTAPVVRSYVENHLEMQGRITRLYYIGPMFRYDRPQAGRYRQFYQYGAECIGSHHPYYDAEIIAMQVAFLRKLGLKKIELEINSVGCPNCSKDYDRALVEYFTPHKTELCEDCNNRLVSKPRRLLDCKVPSCKAIAKDAPVMLDYLDKDCNEHYRQVKNYLDKMQIIYRENPRIVRGLDYYTHTAFEFLNPALGAQNAIGGGGRYDGLIAQIGGKDTPAVGIAGGFERLLLSLEQEGIVLGEENRSDAFLILMGEAARETGIELLAEWRLAGLGVAYDPEKESFKAQLKAADSAGARYALIIGEDEVKSDQVTVKDLKSGEQSAVPVRDLVKTILNS
jgi:histidyl-tRNA synthetase